MKQALAPAAVLLSLTSCASLFNTQKPLSLTSTPPGVSFSTSDGQHGRTPATFIPRDYRQSVTFTLQEPGYQTVTVEAKVDVSPWVFGNLLFFPLGTLLFGSLDLVNEGAWRFRDDHLHVELVPLQGAAANAVTLPDEVVFHADLAHDSEDAGK